MVWLFLAAILVLSPLQEISGSPAVIQLNLKDQRFVDDALSEILNSAKSKAMMNNERNRRLESAFMLVRPYCECSDEDFKDWTLGKGLPSIDRKMQSKSVPTNTALKIEFELSEVRLRRHDAEKEDIHIMELKKLLGERMLQAFIDARPIPALALNQYNLDLVGKKFIKRSLHQFSSAAQLEYQVETQVESFIHSKQVEIDQSVVIFRQNMKTLESIGSAPKAKPNKKRKPQQKKKPPANTAIRI